MYTRGTRGAGAALHHYWCWGITIRHSHCVRRPNGNWMATFNSVINSMQEVSDRLGMRNSGESFTTRDFNNIYCDYVLPLIYTADS